jgi:serine/threonine protein kinase
MRMPVHMDTFDYTRSSHTAHTYTHTILAHTRAHITYTLARTHKHTRTLTYTNTHRECYSKEADVWSLGVVMFIALGGYAPFDGKNEREVSKAKSNRCGSVCVCVNACVFFPCECVISGFKQGCFIRTFETFNTVTYMLSTKYAYKTIVFLKPLWDCHF